MSIDPGRIQPTVGAWLLFFTGVCACAAGAVEHGVVYGRAGRVELKMDLAQPAEGAGPFPAIIWIHGGGWRMGDRAWGDSYIQMLADNGYVAVTISYRFAPEFKWPAQIHDAKAAVRYVRAHAQALKVDPDHIGVMGESSGGHLALMIGLTGPADRLEGASGTPGVSSRVQAVVSYCTLTDFTQLKPQSPTTERPRRTTRQSAGSSSSWPGPTISAIRSGASFRRLLMSTAETRRC